MLSTCCLTLFLLFAACGQAIAASADLDVSDFPDPGDGGKWGYMKDTTTGEILLAPDFFGYGGGGSSLDASILPAQNAQGTWGYVDAVTGKVVIAPQFYNAGFFYDGIAKISRSYPDKAHKVTAVDDEDKESPAVVVPVAEGLIGSDGREILPALYDLSRVGPRLFKMKNARGAKAVFHADKGYIVPPGECDEFRFTSEGGVFCGGSYYEPDGTRHTPPAGIEITHLDPETGLFLLEQKKKDALGSKGVMRRDGSLLVPVKYDNIKAVPAAGVWLASRIDVSFMLKIAAAAFSSKKPNIDKGKDSLTVDVYDANGALLHSFRAAAYPGVSGEHYTYASKGREYEVNARTGEAVPEREEPTDPTSAFQPFKKGGKYGIKNAEGAISVQAIYDRLSSLGSGLFEATQKHAWYTDNWGVIDGNGREIIPFIYGGFTGTYPTWETGPLRVMRWRSKGEGERGPTAYEGHWLMDRDGRYITPMDRPYSIQFYFNDVGLAVVSRDGKEGVIDHTGKEVLPIEYSTVFDELRQSEGKKRRGAGREKSVEDSAGAAVLTAKDALYRVKRGSLWGLYDGTGKELIPIQYGFISLDVLGDLNLEQGWVRVEDEDRNKYGVVNFRTGQTIAPIYSNMGIYPGFFLASMRYDDDKRNEDIMLDRRGQEVGRYNQTEWLKDAGVLAARVGRDDNYSLLDGTGKQIFPARCENVWQATASFVWCRTDAGKMLVDNTGREYRIP